MAEVSGPVRVGLIGAGGIAGAHLKGFIKHRDKLHCIAMADVSQESIQKRAEQVGGSPRAFSDWKVMLREMHDLIDAVDICLPHHLHGTAILDACAAGKHIICEKPMCTSLAEADRILDAVNASGVMYMSAHNQLFMPVVQEARRMIESGELGQIFWIRSQDCFAAGNTDRGKWGWRADRKTQGGGELIDTGYHPTYRLLHLAGSQPAQIRGILGRFALNIDGEDTASVHIRFENGILGEILTSWAMRLPFGTHHIHVIGEQGQLFGSDNTLYHLPKDANEPQMRSFAEVDTFEAELAHFADCLVEGKRPLHGAEEGRAVLEVIQRACESDAGWEKSAVVKVQAALACAGEDA